MICCMLIVEAVHILHSPCLDRFRAQPINYTLNPMYYSALAFLCADTEDETGPGTQHQATDMYV